MLKKIIEQKIDEVWVRNELVDAIDEYGGINSGALEDVYNETKEKVLNVPINHYQVVEVIIDFIEGYIISVENVGVFSTKEEAKKCLRDSYRERKERKFFCEYRIMELQ